MFLQNAISKRIDNDNPVKVALIGAGKFGSMFLSQVPTTPGLEVAVIADLKPENAIKACKNVGWSDDLISKTKFVDEATQAIRLSEVDVVVEATGFPAAGIEHARQAFQNGKHIIMVNVEADVLAGAALVKEAKSAGVVYSMAYGDQPALTAEIVEWARASGFHVSSAGKGTRYLPAYHKSTPDTVWDYYGLSHEEAAKAGMNPKMFNSFLDGTKSGLEMAAIANACGLEVPNDGLLFPPCGMDDLANILKPSKFGGILEQNGQVEVVSSFERDGRPVFKDLRWGVFAVLEAPNDYAASCFKQYGMNTDNTGQFSAMYKPFHLIGMELNISIFSAALLNQATGQTQKFTGDVVSTTKRNLKKGEMLDGEGGATVWGKLIPAKLSLSLEALPIGLAHGIKLKNEIKENEIIKWSDVEFSSTDPAISYRRSMEADAKIL
ncbi:Gfo/Idh/MocA family oxidoreductase [Pseudomonadota bacterium]|jgi:predicted homoserine dehydrogenase-like protein|nr:Gfo/Idh/MocA family oxidoreductase [Pseudomonadota bacterium]|tara:strand:- start:892 stop:2202 length:1311 start_codon:yes stop_codon:yes gene_type:complete